MNSTVRRPRLVQRLRSIQSGLATTSGAFAAVVIVVLALLITVAALARYTGTGRVRGAHEIAGYLQVALVYVGLSAAFAHGQFIRVELLYGRLKGWRRTAFDVGNHLLGLVAVAALAYYSGRLVVEAHARGTRSVGELRVLLYPFFAVVVLGIVLLGIQIMLSLLLVLAGDKPVPASGELSPVDPRSTEPQPRPDVKETRWIGRLRLR